MKAGTRLLLCVVLGPFVLWKITLAASEPAWPPSQTRIIIANSLGGGTDVVTRAFGQTWEKLLGTRFVYRIANGAAGRIGYDTFINSTNNGEFELLASNVATAAIMYSQQNPSWNWSKDLTPVGLMAIDPGILFVRKNSKFKTLAQLLKAAKTRTLRLSLANWASTDNMLVQEISDDTGSKFQVIPALGANPIITAVLGNNVEVGFTKLSTLMRAGGNVRYLAVTLPKNPAPKLTNNIPTVDSVIDKKTTPIASYRVIMARAEFKKKHPEQFAKVMSTFQAAKSDPRFLTRAQKLGFRKELLSNWSPAEIDDMVQRYWAAYKKYGKLFKVR